ncbi:MAG: hypothetical protein ACP5D2_03780 [Candidatus Nanoarchaeia archaeon]
MEYELEIDRLKKIIREKKPKKVLLQLPDGLKPKAAEIVNKLGDLTSVFIWFGSCYGACDVPPVSNDDYLVVQFGHAPWR